MWFLRSILDYVASVGESVALAGIGGIFAYMGGKTLVPAVMLYFSHEEAAANAGMTTRELLRQSSLALSNSVVPMVSSSGYLVLGSALLFVGIRNLIRQVKAGLPSDDASVPKSEFDWFRQILAYGTVTVIGLFRLAVVTVDTFDPLILSISGQQTTAEIVRMWQQDQIGQGRPLGDYFDYSFRTADGRTITGARMVPSSDFQDEFGQGSRIAVNYALGDPKIHDFPTLISWSHLAMGIVSYLLIVVFGVWKLKRLLKMGRRDSDPKDDRTVHRVRA